MYPYFCLLKYLSIKVFKNDSLDFLLQFDNLKNFKKIVIFEFSKITI